MNERVDELARILTQENGKPLEESGVETQVAAASCSGTPRGARIYGETVPTGQPRPAGDDDQAAGGRGGRRSPWNFPTSMVTRKVGPAAGGGLHRSLPPARATPLVAVAIFKIFDEVGPSRAWSTWSQAPSRPRWATRWRPTRWCAS